MLGTKEHYELLEQFEKNFGNMRLDREEKEMWKIGAVYQNGETNNMYKAYILGYSLGKIA